jgi:hypothetical protein
MAVHLIPLFGQSRVHENLLIAEDMLDTMNEIHVRIILNFLTPNSYFLVRFPLKIYNRVSFQVNACPQECVTSQPCEIEQIQHKFLCPNEVNDKDGQRRTILTIYFTLPTNDHVENYFILMKSNWLLQRPISTISQAKAFINSVFSNKVNQQ